MDFEGLSPFWAQIINDEVDSSNPDNFEVNPSILENARKTFSDIIKKIISDLKNKKEVVNDVNVFYELENTTLNVKNVKILEIIERITNKIGELIPKERKRKLA